MAIACALLVSDDVETIEQFKNPLQQMSISSDVCRDGPAAISLLKRRKFDAVIVDFQLGQESGTVLDELRLSASNRTTVTLAISGGESASTAASRKKVGVVIERPLSPLSVRGALKAAYGLILRERRHYFRCPVSIPVVILRPDVPGIRCASENISEGGMALSTSVRLKPGERIQVQFTLPGHKAPLLVDSTVCWWKTGHIGVHFISLSPLSTSELQDWLSGKLEETLPDFVARKFQNSPLPLRELRSRSLM
jgi:CheY-like chemotaxis protein